MQSLPCFFLFQWKCQNIDCAGFLVHFKTDCSLQWHLQKYPDKSARIIWPASSSHTTASPGTTPDAPEYSNCHYKWIRPTTSSYSIANVLKFILKMFVQRHGDKPRKNKDECADQKRQLAYHLACSLWQHFFEVPISSYSSGELWPTSESPGGYAFFWNFLKPQRDGAMMHYIGSNKNSPLLWVLAQPFTEHISSWPTVTHVAVNVLRQLWARNITNTDIFISYAFSFHISYGTFES